MYVSIMLWRFASWCLKHFLNILVWELGSSKIIVWIILVRWLLLCLRLGLILLMLFVIRQLLWRGKCVSGSGYRGLVRVSHLLMCSGRLVSCLLLLLLWLVGLGRKLSSFDDKTARDRQWLRPFSFENLNLFLLVHDSSCRCRCNTARVHFMVVLRRSTWKSRCVPG